jgi:protein involved in sex pheromone biosynthesis
MKEIKMFNKKKVFIYIIVAVVFSLVGCADQEQGQEDEGLQKNDEIVAIVNEEEIKRNEFETLLDSKLMGYQQQGLDLSSPEGEELLEQLRIETLDDLINMKVLIQGAEREGYEASSAQVDEQLQSIKQQFEDEAQFEEALALNSITLDELEQQISDQVKIDQYISEEVGQVSVTEEEMRQFYDDFSKDAEDVPDYEELAPQIEQHLTEEKRNEKISTFLEELKNQSEIEIIMNV